MALASAKPTIGESMDTSLRLRSQLLSIERPLVMGILNATPDSFYQGSRTPVTAGAASLVARARQLVAEGADLLDIGAVSTRPDVQPASEADEMARLDAALGPLRDAMPDVPLSVDTFRASVARHVVERYGVEMVNDISGCADPEMQSTVAELGVAYVLTHNPSAMASGVGQPNNCAALVDDDAKVPIDVRVAQFFARRTSELYAAGVTDVILDPGFGFAKTLDENYALMRALPRLIGLFPQVPFLIGISRKSMIYRLLGTTPEDSLNGTTVLNTIALQAGAHILRVHDVGEAVEAVKIVSHLGRV